MTLSSLQRDESVVGWSQTKLLAEPVWENRTKGKRDINTWRWWPTHPTNTPSIIDSFSSKYFSWLYFSELWELIPWWLLLVTMTQPDSCNRWIWSESDTFQGTSQQLREVGSANKRNRGKMGNPPPQIWLRFSSTRGGSQEDEKPPRPGRHHQQQGWPENGFAGDSQVRILNRST